jgi:hypothetical protein
MRRHVAGDYDGFRHSAVSDYFGNVKFTISVVRTGTGWRPPGVRIRIQGVVGPWSAPQGLRIADHVVERFGRVDGQHQSSGCPPASTPAGRRPLRM